MSVQSEIDRIHGNVQDTIAAIRQTGISVPSGANSDNLPALAEALANEKQDKLTGTEGQVVGFNKAGEAVAQDAPEGGLTQEAADARYLKLTGGTLSGDLGIPLHETAGGPGALQAEIQVGGTVLKEDMDGSYLRLAGLGQVTSGSTLAVGMLPDNAASVADASGFLFSDGRMEAAGIPAGITATKDLSMAGHKVTGLAAPAADADAATKAYVDAAAEAVVPVSRGGTGKTTFTLGQALVGAGTNPVVTRPITNNTSTSSSIDPSTNLITESTLRYAINRTSSVAASNTSYGTYMARGIAAGTADLTAGESALTSGCIYFVYE